MKLDMATHSSIWSLPSSSVEESWQPHKVLDHSICPQKTPMWQLGKDLCVCVCVGLSEQLPLFGRGFTRVSYYFSEIFLFCVFWFPESSDRDPEISRPPRNSQQFVLARCVLLSTKNRSRCDYFRSHVLHQTYVAVVRRLSFPNEQNQRSIYSSVSSEVRYGPTGPSKI